MKPADKFLGYSLAAISLVTIVLSAAFLGNYLPKLFSTSTSEQTNPSQQISQPRQQIAQKPSDEGGRTLAGGTDACKPATVNIKNNNFSPTSITAVWHTSNNQWCVRVL